MTEEIYYSSCHFDGVVVVELLRLDNLDDVVKFWVESNGAVFEHDVTNETSFSLAEIFPEPLPNKIRVHIQYRDYDRKQATVTYIPYIGDNNTDWLNNIPTFSRCNIPEYKYIEFGLSINSGTPVRHRTKIGLEVFKQVPLVLTDRSEVSVYTYDYTLFGDFYPENTENVVNHHSLALSGHPALLFTVRKDYLPAFATAAKGIDKDADIIYHDSYAVPEEDQRKYENELALSVELIYQQMLFLKGRRSTLPLTVEDL